MDPLIHLFGASLDLGFLLKLHQFFFFDNLNKKILMKLLGLLVVASYLIDPDYLPDLKMLFFYLCLDKKMLRPSQMHNPNVL